MVDKVEFVNCVKSDGTKLKLHNVEEFDYTGFKASNIFKNANIKLVWYNHKTDARYLLYIFYKGHTTMLLECSDYNLTDEYYDRLWYIKQGTNTNHILHDILIDIYSRILIDGQIEYDTKIIDKVLELVDDNLMIEPSKNIITLGLSYKKLSKKLKSMTDLKNYSRYDEVKDYDMQD